MGVPPLLQASRRFGSGILNGLSPCISPTIRISPNLARFKSDQAEVESTSLVRPRIPDHTPTLLAIPISRRPLFPGFYKTITVKDGQVAAAMAQAMRRGRPWVGLFMQRHESKHEDDLAEEGDTISHLSDIHRVIHAP